MENNQVGEKKFGLPILAAIVALAIAVTGVVRVSDAPRITILSAQALLCIFIVIMNFKTTGDKRLEWLKYLYVAYALIEAMRAALIVTTGVNPVVAALARFMLAVLAAASVQAADKLDTKECAKTATAVVVVETILFLVFVFGFEGVMHGRINRVLQFTGILVTGSLGLYAKSLAKVTEGEKEVNSLLYFLVCLGIAVVAVVVKSFV